MRTKLLKITVCSLLLVTTALCQQKNGSITGVVKDTAQAVLPGARVTVSQKGYITSSNSQGQFTVIDLPPGTYKVTASYVGFAPQSVDVTVNAGQVTRSDVVLPIGLQSEVVTVNGSRQRGEVEAINVERNADNIVQVLPNEVITSLPNTNIADAVGRLPSGSLERDEGEGKYIQIRGTEPRLSNVTVDGIHLPSPENVRNVKLDVIPADLVDSIEVNKTLSANQEADAIGGSVNLVTKTSGDQPYVTLLGLGGYTPIEGGRPLYQLTGTVGNRFGTHKQFGVLVGGSYDYNARGIDDVEPVSAVNPLPNGANFIGPNTEDIRQYQYDRTRTGFTGEADYRLGNMSSVYIRGLFSKFRDFGQDWIYSPAVSNFISNLADPTQNTCGIPTNTTGTVGCGNISFANVFRQPVQQIFSVQAGARHNIGTFLLNALSQAKATGG